MRIIAGRAKGIKLKMVPGNHVRPTSDRVKESIFQILGPYFQGGRVLDLFAGTGALGLEALSRGMDEAVFVDQSIKSIQTIRSNIQHLGMENEARVIRREAKSACRWLGKHPQKFELIFVDPPYHNQFLHSILKEISKQKLLAIHGKVVVELPTSTCLPEEIGTLKKSEERSYGQTSIFIYHEPFVFSQEEQK